MALVRYLGPHTDGILASNITDAVEHEVGHGETVELPDELVFGTEPVLDDDGDVITPGYAGLLAQGHDANGPVDPQWELVVDGTTDGTTTDDSANALVDAAPADAPATDKKKKTRAPKNDGDPADPDKE